MEKANVAMDLASFSIDFMSLLCWTLKEEHILTLWSTRDKRLQRSLLRPGVIDHWAPYGFFTCPSSLEMEHRWFLRELHSLKHARIRVRERLQENWPYISVLNPSSLEVLKIDFQQEKIRKNNSLELKSTYGKRRMLDLPKAGGGKPGGKTSSLEAVTAMLAKKNKATTLPVSLRNPGQLGLSFQELPFVKLRILVVTTTLPSFPASPSQPLSQFLSRSSTTAVSELKEYWVQWMKHLPRTLECLNLESCLGVQGALQASADHLPVTMTDLRLVAITWADWIEKMGLSGPEITLTETLIHELHQSMEISDFSRLSSSLPLLRILDMPISSISNTTWLKTGISKSVIIGPSVKELTLRVSTSIIPRFVLPFTLEHLTILAVGVMHPAEYDSDTLPWNPYTIPGALWANAETSQAAAAELPKSPIGLSPFSSLMTTSTTPATTPNNTSFSFSNMGVASSKPTSSSMAGTPPVGFPKFSFKPPSMSSEAASEPPSDQSTAKRPMFSFAKVGTPSQASSSSATSMKISEATPKLSFKPPVKTIAMNAQSFKTLPNLQSLSMLVHSGMQVAVYPEKTLNEFYHHIPSTLTSLTLTPQYWPSKEARPDSPENIAIFLSNLPELIHLSLIHFTALSFNLSLLPIKLQDLEMYQIGMPASVLIPQLQRLTQLRNLIVGKPMFSEADWTDEEVASLLKACPLLHLTLIPNGLANIRLTKSHLPGALMPRVPSLSQDPHTPLISPELMNEAVYDPIQPEEFSPTEPHLKVLNRDILTSYISKFFNHRVTGCIRIAPPITPGSLVPIGMPTDLEVLDLWNAYPSSLFARTTTLHPGFHSRPGKSMSQLIRDYFSIPRRAVVYANLSHAPSSFLSSHLIATDGVWWNGLRDGQSTLHEPIMGGDSESQRPTLDSKKLLWMSQPFDLCEIIGMKKLKSLAVEYYGMTRQFVMGFDERAAMFLNYLPRNLVHLKAMNLFNCLKTSSCLPPTLETLVVPTTVLGSYIPGVDFKFDPHNPLPNLTTFHTAHLLLPFVPTATREEMAEYFMPPSITSFSTYALQTPFHVLQSLSSKLPNLHHCAIYVGTPPAINLMTLFPTGILPTLQSVETHPNKDGPPYLYRPSEMPYLRTLSIINPQSQIGPSPEAIIQRLVFSVKSSPSLVKLSLASSPDFNCIAKTHILTLDRLDDNQFDMTLVDLWQSSTPTAINLSQFLPPRATGDSLEDQNILTLTKPALDNWVRNAKLPEDLALAEYPEQEEEVVPTPCAEGDPTPSRSSTFSSLASVGFAFGDM